MKTIVEPVVACKPQRKQVDGEERVEHGRAARWVNVGSDKSSW